MKPETFGPETSPAGVQSPGNPTTNHQQTMSITLGIIVGINIVIWAILLHLNLTPSL
jgi:hypothetical protein